MIKGSKLKVVKKVQGYISIWLTNVDSLSNKFVELQSVLGFAEFLPDLILLNEVNPKNSRFPQSISEYQLKGWQTLSSGFQEEGCRGLLLYYKESLSVIEINMKTLFQEKLCIRFLASRDFLNILLVYRSPNSLTENNELFINMLEEFMLLKGEHLLLGDFNFPEINWLTSSCAGSHTKIENMFLKFLEDNFMIQHITEPTRFRTGQTPHLLDLVVTSREIIDSIRYLSPLGGSDHSIITFRVCLEIAGNFGCDIRPCFDLGDYAGFNGLIGESLTMVFEEELSVEIKWSIFRDTLLEFTRRFVPHKAAGKKFRFRMTNELRGLIKLKHQCWRQIYRYGAIEKFPEFRKYRQKVRDLSTQLERENQNFIAANFRTNPKRFWNFVHKKTKCRDSPSMLTVNGSVLTEGYEKARAFAEFFASVYVRDADSGLTGTLPFSPGVPEVGMGEVIIDSGMLDKKLRELDCNKSAGPDGIHPRVLKETHASINVYLKHIFDCSMQSGEVVEDWRSSCVVPLFKKGRKDIISNYRPVALTSVCCKILESIIKDHLLEYFLKNNLFAKYQFGFLPSRSTTLQMLGFLDVLTKAVDVGNEVDVIYTDLEKAFDKIPHEKLLYKLERYKVHDQVLRWIRGYLNNRTFRVRLNGEYSGALQVVSGVPQGSVLGPLLFLIYINDIYTVCESMFLFADDAKLFKVLSSKEDCFRLQNDINGVVEWFNRWQMHVNMGKCCLLHVGGKHFINKYHLIDLDGTTCEIPTLESVSDLGIIMDSKLQFKDHILTRVKKANMMLGIIARNFRKLSDEAFISVYKALVRSQLEYGVQVWYPYRQGMIDAIERVQRRATKLLPSCAGMPYEMRLKKLKLPTLINRRIRADLILLFDLLAGDLRSLVCPSLTICTYERTRGHDRKLATTGAHKDCRKYFFANRVIQEWNRLPQSVVSAGDSYNFRLLLDAFWGETVYGL